MIKNFGDMQEDEPHIRPCRNCGGEATLSECIKTVFFYSIAAWQFKCNQCYHAGEAGSPESARARWNLANRPASEEAFIRRIVQDEIKKAALDC